METPPLNFADHLWDQFHVVIKRHEEGNQFFKEVASFVSKRAALEKEYAQKLQKLAKSTTIEEYASLGAAWTSLRSETEKLSTWHDLFADRLTMGVKNLLLDKRKEGAKHAKIYVEQGNRLIKELESQTEKYDKAKLAFYRSRKKHEETQDEYDRATQSIPPSSMAQKLGKKVKKEEKVALKAEKAYKAAISSLVETQVKVHDKEMPRTMNSLQQLEVARVEVTRTSLEQAIILQMGLAEQVTERCTAMLEAAKAVDPQVDVQAFVEKVRTHKDKPPKAEYEPYDRLSWAQQNSPGNGTVIHPKAQRKTLGSLEPQPLTPPITPTPSPSPSPISATSPTASAPNMARALFDYSGETDAELSFKQGDVIKILEKDNSGWWQGELNGRLGAFPSGWVEEVPHRVGGTAPEAPVLLAPPPPLVCPTKEIKVRALFDFEPQSSEEVEMHAGDTITVERDDTSGWMYGVNNNSGQRGRFPANYVAAE